MMADKSTPGGDRSASGDPSPPARFPQRDDNGRIALLTELLAYTLGATALGVAMLAAIDGVFALLGFGSFGQISGWISGLLAVFIFVDDFRAWRENPMRWAIAAVGAVLGVVVGLGVVSQLPPFWLPLFNGSIAVAAGAMLYSVLWFIGVRLVGGDR